MSSLIFVTVVQACARELAARSTATARRHVARFDGLDPSFQVHGDRGY